MRQESADGQLQSAHCFSQIAPLRQAGNELIQGRAERVAGVEVSTGASQDMVEILRSDLLERLDGGFGIHELAESFPVALNEGDQCVKCAEEDENRRIHHNELN